MSNPDRKKLYAYWITNDKNDSFLKMITNDQNSDEVIFWGYELGQNVYDGATGLKDDYQSLNFSDQENEEFRKLLQDLSTDITQHVAPEEVTDDNTKEVLAMLCNQFRTRVNDTLKDFVMVIPEEEVSTILNYL